MCPDCMHVDTSMSSTCPLALHQNKLPCQPLSHITCDLTIISPQKKQTMSQSLLPVRFCPFPCYNLQLIFAHHAINTQVVKTNFYTVHTRSVYIQIQMRNFYLCVCYPYIFDTSLIHGSPYYQRKLISFRSASSTYRKRNFQFKFNK